MTQVMSVLSSLVGSRLLSAPLLQSERSSCKLSVTPTTNPVTVCQCDNANSSSSSESSRRSFMFATASASGAVLFLHQPDALAAKRKPAPPPEEKKPDDDKYLSAYDAKLLANSRRKEALKALVETQKSKAKTASNIEAPRDIFGQVPN